MLYKQQLWLILSPFSLSLRPLRRRSPSLSWPSCLSRSPSTSNNGISHPSTRHRSETPRRREPTCWTIALLSNSKLYRMKVCMSAVDKKKKSNVEDIPVIIFAKCLLVKDCLVKYPVWIHQKWYLKAFQNYDDNVYKTMHVYCDGRCLRNHMNMQVKQLASLQGVTNTVVNQDVDPFLFACVCLVIDTMWYKQLLGVKSPLSWSISVVETCSSYWSFTGSRSDEGCLLLCSHVASTLLRRQGKAFILMFWEAGLLLRCA